MPPTGQPTIDFSNLDDAELSQMLRDYGVDVGPINAATRRTYERKLMKLKTGAEPAPRYEPVEDDDDDDDEIVTVRTSERNLLKSKHDAATSPRYQPSEIIRGGYEVSAKKVYEEKPLGPKIGATSSSRYQPVDDDDDDEEVQIRRSEPTSRPVPVLSEPPQTHFRKVREVDYSPRVESRPSLPSQRMTPATYTSPVSRSSPIKPLPENRKSSLLWLKLMALAVAVILLYLIYVNMEPAARSNIPGIPNKIEV